MSTILLSWGAVSIVGMACFGVIVWLREKNKARLAQLEEDGMSSAIEGALIAELSDISFLGESARSEAR